VYINPRLVRVEGTLEAQEERCLSLPTIRGTVRRQPIVEIEATDLEGRVFRMESSDMMARCWQHEMDHLDGVLIIDRMSSMDRLVNRTKLRALEERE
jgi:peptide deformylase